MLGTNGAKDGPDVVSRSLSTLSNSSMGRKSKSRTRVDVRGTNESPYFTRIAALFPDMGKVATCFFALLLLCARASCSFTWL